MNSILKSGILAKGRGELEKFLQGGKISAGRSLKAKCYDCMGGYADGRMDCQINSCPLYPFMPYRDNPPAKPERSAKQKAMDKASAERLRKIKK